MRRFEVREMLWGASAGIVIAATEALSYFAQLRSGASPAGAEVGFGMFLAPIRCFPFGMLFVYPAALLERVIGPEPPTLNFAVMLVGLVVNFACWGAVFAMLSRWRRGKGAASV